MKRLLVLAALAVPATTFAAAKDKAPAAAAAKNGPPEGFAQWQLPNGLKVLFLPDHKAPVVTVQVFYHAGAKDEPIELRGMAHMFEHMMFKGSRHVPPEEHARFIDAVGGNENAFTQDDLTAYHDTLPPSSLEFALKLEAERMRNLVLTQKTINSEREVVKEELRLNFENNPIQQAVLKVLALAYTKHPYRLPAIGTKETLDHVTVEACQKFYDMYYRPNNATLIIVGDTDEATVRKLADTYFAPLEKGPEPVHPNIVEPPQTEKREATLELPVQLPVIIGAYHIPAAASDDMYALEVLQQVLSGGESSRLYQRLVRKDKTAVFAGGFAFAHEDPGLFLTFAAFLPGANNAETVQKIKSSLDEEIAGIATKPIDAKELEKAKNQLAARAVDQREHVSGMATALGLAALVNHDALRPFQAPAKYDAITAADVQRVAKAYLVPTNFSQVTLIPKSDGKGGAK